jgi:hypothetical protein
MMLNVATLISECSKIRSRNQFLERVKTQLKLL